MKKSIRNEVPKYQSCKSAKKNASRLLLPKWFWRCASTTSFRKYKQKVVLIVIYLFNYASSKSTFFMLNMGFDVELGRFFVKQIGILCSCNTGITRTFFYLLILCILSCTFLQKTNYSPSW